MSVTELVFHAEMRVELLRLRKHVTHVCHGADVPRVHVHDTVASLMRQASTAAFRSSLVVYVFASA